MQRCAARELTDCQHSYKASSAALNCEPRFRSEAWCALYLIRTGAAATRPLRSRPRAGRAAHGDTLLAKDGAAAETCRLKD